MDQTLKQDINKPRISLMPLRALADVVAVFEFGAGKYSPHGWRSGIHYSRLFDACWRHIYAYWRGEDFDPETGLPHLAHAVANLLMMIETDSQFDDRRQK